MFSVLNRLNDAYLYESKLFDKNAWSGDPLKLICYFKID